MKIAVYTGTFNPMHIGHLAIIRHLTNRMDFGMVYLVVSPQSPFKEYMKAESGAERYWAASDAVSRHPELKVMVDDIELGMPAPQYTIRTLDAIAEREPGNSFTFVLGADNLADIRRWKDYGRILSDYGVAVYPRQGYDMGMTRADLMSECVRPAVQAPAAGPAADSACPDNGIYKITLMENAPMVDISSSELRAAFAAGIDASAYLM